MKGDNRLNIAPAQLIILHQDLEQFSELFTNAAVLLLSTLMEE